MGKGANPGQCVHFVCLAMSGERGKHTGYVFLVYLAIIAPTKFRLGKHAEITFWTKLNRYFKQIRSILKGQCSLPRCGQKTK